MKTLWWINIGALVAMGMLASSGVGAIEPGTYDGGFTSKAETLKLELRCLRATDTSIACELEMTHITGGSAPETRPLRANGLEPLGGCKTAPSSQWDECNFGLWKELQDSLQFARDHRTKQANPEARKILAPLFKTEVALKACYRFRQDDAFTFCELASSPWGKPVLMYFGQTYSGCDPSGPFCEYSILPLFKTGDSATLRGQRSLGPAPQPPTIPASQAMVAPYVKQLEAAVRRVLVVPPGTPASARVAYQIQFSQETGYVANVAFTGGCYCPALRGAVAGAVAQIKPFPLLPKQQQPFIGGHTGIVYLETSAANP